MATSITARMGRALMYLERKWGERKEEGFEELFDVGAWTYDKDGE